MEPPLGDLLADARDTEPRAREPFSGSVLVHASPRRVVHAPAGDVLTPRTRQPEKGAMLGAFLARRQLHPLLPFTRLFYAGCVRFLDVYIVALPEKTRALYDALSNTLWDPARIRFHQRKPRVWNAAEEPPAVADLGGVSEVTLTITSWSGWETGARAAERCSRALPLEHFVAWVCQEATSVPAASSPAAITGWVARWFGLLAVATQRAFAASPLKLFPEKA
ncbi:unnamed protein product [Symbiodinium microadriaticum]|nr:unnamed protein product [Symbiodinium microadriaticum]